MGVSLRRSWSLAGVVLTLVSSPSTPRPNPMQTGVTRPPTTVVFPGQGSQRPGMGRDFDGRFDASRRVYDEASEALALDMRRLCFAPDSRLALTEYVQPAILATEIASPRGRAGACGM